MYTRFFVPFEAIFKVAYWVLGRLETTASKLRAKKVNTSYTTFLPSATYKIAPL